MLRPMKRTVRVSHVEVYVFRRRGRRVEILCLRRAKTIPLPGAWQPVTGRIERGERALVAAAREVREETGLTPIRWWGLETLSIWFESSTEQLAALPLYAAEAAPAAEVTLSREHSEFAWLSPAAAAKRFVWETQRKGLVALDREVLRAKSPLALERSALLEELTRKPRSGTGGSSPARPRSTSRRRA
jgi:dATP pyrophosphohydrolase